MQKPPRAWCKLDFMAEGGAGDARVVRWAELRHSARRRLLEAQDDEVIDVDAIVAAVVALVDIGARESLRISLTADLEQLARELDGD